jgi:hypothetical protein
MSSSNPLVSVIVPAYNAANYISDAIKSICNQTWPHWELIVVNDGSVDETAKIVADFCREDPRIQMITQENGKLAKARNTGLAAACGQFIAFLDADDVWQPDKLAKQIQVYQETGANLVFSDAFHFPESRSDLPVRLFGKWVGFFSSPEMFKNLYSGNAIPVSSALVHRAGETEDLHFDDSSAIRGLEDYEMWLRLSSRGASFFGVNEKLTGYRTHATQMSRRALSMLKSEIAVRQKYRTIAEKAGINVLRQDRVDIRNLAYWNCNEGNREAAWSAISNLCNVHRFGLTGLSAASGATLHMLFHLVHSLASNPQQSRGVRPGD